MDYTCKSKQRLAHVSLHTYMYFNISTCTLESNHGLILSKVTLSKLVSMHNCGCPSYFSVDYFGQKFLNILWIFAPFSYSGLRDLVRFTWTLHHLRTMWCEHLNTNSSLWTTASSKTKDLSCLYLNSFDQLNHWLSWIIYSLCWLAFSHFLGGNLTKN